MMMREELFIENDIKILIKRDEIHHLYADDIIIDLIRIFQMCGSPETVNYLFLGDYVDRGRFGLETICLLFACKIKYLNSFYLLPGNHESQDVTKIYGFCDECKRRYNIKLRKTFVDTFNYLPIVAVIEDKIFCCHGVERPIDIPLEGPLIDSWWSEPTDTDICGAEYVGYILIYIYILYCYIYMNNKNINKNNKIKNNKVEYINNKNKININNKNKNNDNNKINNNNQKIEPTPLPLIPRGRTGCVKRFHCAAAPTIRNIQTKKSSYCEIQK